MLDELNILKQLLPSLPQAEDVVAGPGDDCAAVACGGRRILLAAADQLVGGVHYYRETTSPETVSATFR